MIGFKGLKVKNNTILSPAYQAIWGNGKLSADPNKIREDNLAGIHIANQISEALGYSSHVFLVRGYGKAAIHDRGGRFQHAEIVAYLDLGEDIPDVVSRLGIPVIHPADMVEFGINHPKVDRYRDVIEEDKGLIAFGRNGGPIHVRPNAKIRDIYIYGNRNGVYIESGCRIRIGRNASVHRLNVICKEDVEVDILGSVCGANIIAPNARIYATGASVEYMHFEGPNRYMGTLFVSMSDTEMNELSVRNAWITHALFETSTVEKIEITSSMVDVLKLMERSTSRHIYIRKSRVQTLGIKRAEVEWITLVASMVADYREDDATVGKIRVDNRGGIA